MQVNDFFIERAHTISNCRNFTLNNAELTGKVELLLLGVSIQSFLELGHCALPRSALISAKRLGLNSEDEATQVVFFEGLALDDDYIVGENLDLLFEGGLLFDF